MSGKGSEHWIIRGAIASAVLSVVVAACVTNEHPRPTCASLADGGVPRIEPPEASTFFQDPSTDAQAPTALGIEPDLGPTCTNCQAGDEYEIMPVSDFEEGFAPAWINYGEPGTTVEPHGVGAECGAAGVPPPYFGLQAVDLRTLPGGARCNSYFALHLEGGRFKTWGGGYATQFMSVRGEQYMEQYCPGGDTSDPMLPQAKQGTCQFWAAPVESQPSHPGIDVSQFDGVALWARRGPGGQSTLRVALLDANTAQESALSAERDAREPACKRVVSCCAVCTELEHYYLDAGVDEAGVEQLGIALETDMRCYVPGEPMPPFRPSAESFEFQPFCGDPNSPWVAKEAAASTQDIKGAWDTWNRDHKPCCPKTLDEDPKYGDKETVECAPYVFKYDFSSGSYCQRPGEKLPEKNDNRCEDAFESNIVIDTEWKLFTIPWAELRRSTLGRAPIDPGSIWTIRLYPTAGWLDTYIDDIGFYRKRQ